MSAYEYPGTTPIEPSVEAELAGDDIHLGGNQLVGDQTVSAEEILRGFEFQHFVKQATSLTEATADADSRTSPVRSVAHGKHISADTMSDESEYGQSHTVTEGEAVQLTLSLIDQLANDVSDLELDDDQLAEITAQLATEDEETGEKVLVGSHDNMDVPEVGNVKDWLAEKLVALRETSFLGEMDIQEASLALALYWKDFLAQDPDNQIVLVEPRSVYRSEKLKSEAYVLEQVLQHYSDDELEQMRGRIIGDIDEATAGIGKLKVVILDDWLMSGDQMQQRLMGSGAEMFAHGHKRESRGLRSYTDAEIDALLGGDSTDLPDEPEPKQLKEFVEVNTLMADERRLAHGFTYDSVFKDIPVKAYYCAPDAVDAVSGGLDDRYASRMTGAHSSGDHHFAMTLHNVISIMNHANEISANGKPPYAMPPLANILRQYRQLDTPQTNKLFPKAA